jgi:hypothetical protein
MSHSKRAGRIAVAAVGFILVIAVVAVLVGPMDARATAAGHWLEKFALGPVSVTFITPPPGKDQTANARLISVESSGVVLRFANESDTFYSYANIVSITPK